MLSLFALFNRNTFDLLGHFCHQIQNRSFIIWDSQIGICGRCLGIYSGIFFFGIFILYNKKVNKYLILLSMIVCSTTIYCKIMDCETNNSLRFISGIFAGILVTIFDYFTYFIISLYLKLLYHINRKMSEINYKKRV